MLIAILNHMEVDMCFINCWYSMYDLNVLNILFLDWKTKQNQLNFHDTIVYNLW